MKHSLIPAYVVVLGSLTLASTSYAAQPEQRAPSIIQVQTVGKQAMPSVAAAPASPTPSAATIVAPRHLAQTKATPAPPPTMMVPGGDRGGETDGTAMRTMYIAMGAMTGFMFATMPVTTAAVTTAAATGIVTMWAYDYFAYPAMAAR